MSSTSRGVDFAELSASLPLATSSDGEISMTVEDTNALRLRLGMKALNSVESSAAEALRTQAERNYELARAARTEARRLADIEAELSRAKRRRLLRASESKGGSLGDALVNDESAKDWVQKHEKQKATLEAERMARLFAEREEVEAAPPPPKIAASSAVSLSVGEERILTLKDFPILESNEHGQVVGLREGEDAMENVELAQEARRKKLLAESRKTNEDDAEFMNVNDFTMTSTVKPLPGEGAVAASMRSQAWGPPKTIIEDTKFQSEYMSPEEAKKFFKKMKKKKVVPVQRRKVVEEEEDMGNDRMSREEALRRRRMREGRLQSDGERRREESFQAAKEKHQNLVDVGMGLKSKEESKEVTKRSIPKKEEDSPPKKKFVEGLGDDEDDAELRAALARARTANHREEKKVLQKPLKKVKEEKQQGLVFTSTTEFTSRLHARLEERAAEVLAASAAPQTHSVKEEEEEEVPEDEEEEEGIDFLHQQPRALAGLASALDLFKSTGDLLPTKPKELQVGRARDQRIFDDDDDDDDNDLKLEYRDADGRLLTRREAFRQLCHRFHGKAPGKKKLEKFQAKIKDDQRSMKHNTGSLSILKHLQEKTGQAYIPIHHQGTVDSLKAAAAASKKAKKKKKEAS